MISNYCDYIMTSDNTNKNTTTNTKNNNELIIISMRNCQKYLFHSLFLSYCQIHLKVESQKTILAYNLITTYPVHGKRSQLWSWSILNSQLVRGVKVINIANLPTTGILNNNFTGQNFLGQEFMLWFTFFK